MPCYQPSSLPSGVTTTGRTGYATEADCLAACQEGACCEGTTCSVQPQCQCQGAGQTFKGVGTVCTPNPCLPCGCSSEQQFQSLQSSVIDLSFSSFAPTTRFGTFNIPGGCDCDSQYGFGGAAIMQQTGFLSEWASHFNSISAQLSYQRSTPESVFWAGDSGEISKPGGGTATYFFAARLLCNGEFDIYRDEENGCQQNSGFVSKSGSIATSGPMAFAPSCPVLQVVNSSIAAQCGTLSLSSQYHCPSTPTTVFCAGVEQVGCFGAANCGGSYFRAGFAGVAAAFVSANPLP